MKIGMQAWGTKGDIYPFFALAEGLAKRGHKVTLGYTSVENIDFFTECENLHIVKVFEKFKDIDSLVPNSVSKSTYFAQINYLIKNACDPAVDDMYHFSKQLCTNNDLVIGHIFCHTLTAAADKYNVRRISLVLFPHTMQTSYASVSGRNFGAVINTLSWSIANYFVKNIFFKQGVILRAKEGLPPIKNISKDHIISQDLTLVAVTPAITRKFPDWGHNIKICGFFDSGIRNIVGQVPAALRQFLDNGSPPIFMTFGSMGDLSKQSSFDFLLRTANLLDERVIIQTSLPLEPLPPTNSNILIINAVPHDQVFSRCSLIVHHGGVGTTQASLRAGKPSVIVVHAYDQEYWAKELIRLGISDRFLVRRKISPEKLAKNIKYVLGENRFLVNAKSISEKMKFEDGVETAIQAIDNCFPS